MVGSLHVFTACRRAPESVSGPPGILAASEIPAKPADPLVASSKTRRFRKPAVPTPHFMFLSRARPSCSRIAPRDQ